MPARWQMIMLYVSLLALLACSHVRSGPTVEEVKANLTCATYRTGMSWEQVKLMLGEPDAVPLPAPGSYLTTARVYKARVVIFNVDTRQSTESGPAEFVEVVVGLEVCR